MLDWRLSNERWEANLSTDPARVAARLGAHSTLCFGRSGAPSSRGGLGRRLWSRGHKDQGIERRNIWRGDGKVYQ